MPYRILKLAYGLARRMYAMATTAERYLLQVGLGLELGYFKPVVPSHTSTSEPVVITATESSDDLMILMNNKDLSRFDGCLIVSSILYIRHYDNILHKEDRCFEKLQFGGNTVVLEMSNINWDVLTKISGLNAASKVLMYDCYFGCEESSFNFRHFLSVFPNLTVFYNDSDSFGYEFWLEDMLFCGLSDMDFIHIRVTSDDLVNVDPADLCNFIDKQKDLFTLELVIVRESETEETNLNELVAEVFGDQLEEVIVKIEKHKVSFHKNQVNSHDVDFQWLNPALLL